MAVSWINLDSSSVNQKVGKTTFVEINLQQTEKRSYKSQKISNKNYEKNCFLNNFLFLTPSKQCWETMSKTCVNYPTIFLSNHSIFLPFLFNFLFTTKCMKNYIKIWGLLRPQVTYQPHSKGTLRNSRLEAEACNFIKKETLAQLYSCEFCEIFQNTFFTEHL